MVEQAHSHFREGVLGWRRPVPGRPKVGLPAWLSVALVAGTTACRPTLPADPRPVFSRAVGVAPSAVRALQSWEMAGGLPLLVGLYETPRGRRAALLPVRQVRGGHVFGSSLPLGQADRIRPLGIVDLRGPGAEVGYRPETVGGELRLPAGARAPALLARVRLGGGAGRSWRAKLVLIVLRPRPRVVWDQEVEHGDRLRAGVRPVGSLNLRPGPGPFLDLEIQRRPVGPGGIPTGPVRLRRFRYRQGRYRETPIPLQHRSGASGVP